MRKIATSIAAIVVCLSMAVFAQNTGQQQNGMNQQDRQFAKMAAKANRAEIQMGNMAEQRASSPAVRDFGKLMVSDHSNAAQNLKNWASQSNFKLPSGLPSQAASTKSSLSSLSGTQFDQQYIQSQLKDHKKVIAAFEKEVEQGQNPQLKQFAENTLPVLQDHVRVAEDLAGKLGMSGKTGLANPSKAITGGQNMKMHK